MTTFNSTQSGNWDDGGTWGLNSPGVAGVDYPGIVGDVVNIGSGHAVAYDAGDSAVVWGNITIAGSLDFPDDADSTLILGSAATLTVNATGSLIVGTLANPIGSAYKAQILFTYPGSSRTFVDTLDGATLSFYGSSSYYGGTYKTTLKANWITGQSFVVDGDVSGWPVNSIITLHKGILYSNYTTDHPEFTVASAVYNSGDNETTVTINETAPGVTFNADCSGWNTLVFNLARNVFIGIDNELTGRVYIRPLQQSGNDLIHFNNVQFQSVYGDARSYSAATQVNNAKYEYCSFKNCYYALDNIGDGEATECILSGTGSAMRNSNRIKTNNVYLVSSYYGFDKHACHPTDCTLHCIGCRYGAGDPSTGGHYICVGVQRCTQYQFKGELIAHNCDVLFYSGEIFAKVWAKDCEFLAVNNAYGIAVGKLDAVGLLYDGYGSLRFTGEVVGTVAADGLSYSGGSFVMENTILNGTLKPYTVFVGGGTVESVFSGDTGYQAIPSANDYGLYIQTNTDLEPAYPFLFSVAANSMFCTVGDSSISFNIYPTGNSPAMTNVDFVLDVVYFDSTGGTATRVVDGNATYPNDEWSTIEIPIAPGKDSFLYWNIHITSVNTTVLLDPIPVIA